MIDRERLLAFLAQRAKESPPGPSSLLVQHAIYEGLAERVKAGEFDSTFRKPPPGWFTFGSHLDFTGEMQMSDEVGEDGLPMWERPLPIRTYTDDEIDCGDWPAPCNHDPAHERKDADT